MCELGNTYIAVCMWNVIVYGCMCARLGVCTCSVVAAVVVVSMMVAVAMVQQFDFAPLLVAWRWNRQGLLEEKRKWCGSGIDGCIVGM